MKIKHFVITRFICNPNLGFGQKIFDKEFIKNNAEISKKYLLKSLLNQTNKNFEIIYLLNDEHDIDFIKSCFKEYFSTIKIYFIKLNDINNFIKTNSEGYDFLITSRIDCDDLIYKYAVNDVQNFILNEKTSHPYYLCGYKYGYRMYNDKDLYNCEYLYTGGFIGLFISLVSNLHYKNLKYINIYNLGNHTKILDRFKTTVPELSNIDDKEYIIKFGNKDFRTFVYVRNNSSSSALLYNNTIKKERDKPIIYDDVFNETFEDNFGFKLK